MIENRFSAPGLVNTLKNRAGFSDDEIDLFINHMELKVLKKKEHHLMAGEVCNYSAYVKKGCLRRYIIDEHSKEIIVNFALEDYWVGDLESLISRKPSIYYFQALEESELLMLSYKNYCYLYNSLPKYKNFHDEKVKRNHYATIKKLSAAKSASPEEKYITLMQEQPQLFQRIPLHYIAAYLGIEPESLSRLRKRMVVKLKIS
jgi:CRP-like cAMP-binding protein